VPRMLPDDYCEPAVGSVDMIGDATGYHPCGRALGEPYHYVCTLPYRHWCRFHVAHNGDGGVLQVKHMRVPKHLRLPEGF